MSAERIQLRRTKGWRKPDGVLNVARPGKCGNPYRIGDPHPDHGWPMSRGDTVRLFSHGFDPYYRRPAAVRPVLDALDGHQGDSVACWCALTEACHGDLILVHLNPDLPSSDWLVTIGTKSAIVQASTLTHALCKVRAWDGKARPAAPSEVAAWNECRDLTSALSRATAAERRELLGIAEPADYDVPLFGASS